MVSICLVSHAPVDSNSGNHVLSLAKGLAEYCDSIIAAFPFLSDSNELSTSRLSIVSFDCLYKSKNMLSKIDIVIYWSPRFMMEQMHKDLCDSYGRIFRYGIHLEDNDLLILKNTFGLSIKQMTEMLYGRSCFRDPNYINLTNVADFICKSNCITALTPHLFDGIPDHIPRMQFWPGFDSNQIAKLSTDEIANLKLTVGIKAEELIIVYTGNVHPSNKKEVRSLYIATSLLNREGIKVKLVRTGQNYGELFDEAEWQSIKPYVIELGVLDLSDIYKLQSLASVLVQPGLVDNWNKYRVPSKIPEFLATGRPVILPKTNLGLVLENYQDAICLDSVNAESITLTLKRFLKDEDDMRRIGANGRKFAINSLNWDSTCLNLFHFICSTL